MLLEIGTASFALAPSENVVPGESGQFSASEAEAGKIIQALLRESNLTLRLSGDASAQPYRYSLEEFPKAYAAIRKACPGS